MNSYNSEYNGRTENTDGMTDMPEKTAETPAEIIKTVSGRQKKSRGQKDLTRRFVTAAAAFGILLSGAAGFGGTLLADRVTREAVQTEISAGIPAAASEDGESILYKAAAAAEGGQNLYSNAIAAVAAKAADTVVSITTETTANDSVYGQYVTGGAGSGVILSEDGTIITCAHVIDGASVITVKTADGAEYKAELIGSDTVTDIAVIKIEASGLPFAVIGDSGLLSVGDDAVAIGNPLGELGGTVTNGIISALDREVEIGGRKYNLLQTNAAINPGNSGGGLFNLAGELIGIVNAKSAGSGIEGLGFAIPVGGALKIAAELTEKGYVPGRPSLGIQTADITDTASLLALRSSENAKLINHITDYGVYFISDEAGNQTGLLYGDRIIAADGIAVSDSSSLSALLADGYAPGDTVKLTVTRVTDIKTRRSEMAEVSVTLTESVPENSSENS